MFRCSMNCQYCICFFQKWDGRELKRYLSVNRNMNRQWRSQEFARKGRAYCKEKFWTAQMETFMASAEREPITGVWGRALSGVQGKSPWSGGQKADSILAFER